MDNSGGKSMMTMKAALLAAASVGVICVVLRHRTRLVKQIRYSFDFRNPLRHKHIEIIETPDECDRAVNALKKTLTANQVLGFDCEWVTVGGTRRPVALLQLSSHQGLSALFRLCCMKQVPKSLRELLDDDKVIKVGVAPQGDAQKLSHDYGVGVASTLDLRFLTALTGHRCEGLAKLSKALLNVQLDKDWRLVCSDWEANVLNDKQVHYAANDALVAVEIFEKLVKELKPRNFWYWRKRDFGSLYECLEPFFDVRFKDGMFEKNGELLKSLTCGGVTKNIALISQGKTAGSRRNISTRTKEFYSNCVLEAPDGELLCTIDRQKAQWYVKKNLGTVVKEKPFTVRLTFEPAGRAVGKVGQYDQTPKENQCVVCGRRDAYIRKNVVPREYRKHFPEVMKTHASHDVLLLCPSCHQLSNISDLKIRKILAKQCAAPILQNEGALKFIEVPELKKVKSAAIALMLNGSRMPANRFEELRQIVMQHFGDERELTQELLEEAVNMDSTYGNENYCTHGAKVVQQYQDHLGGLIALEKLWREHFLHTMCPTFLPDLWNVNYTANRLEIRANEGRIDKRDLLLAGLDANLLQQQRSQQRQHI